MRERMKPLFDAYVKSMKEKGLPGRRGAEVVPGLSEDCTCQLRYRIWSGSGVWLLPEPSSISNRRKSMNAWTTF